MLHVPNQFRVRKGPLASTDAAGNNGAFMIPLKRGQRVAVICGDGFGWEHVSVSRKDRPPLWEEMCQIKELFWDDDDVVLQFHPAKADYVNEHPNCLHLWRPSGTNVPTPDPILVGLKRKE